MSKIEDIGPYLSGKADHLTAADLLGGPRVVRVLDVVRSLEDERPVEIRIDGDLMPWRPCLTMRRLLAACWGGRPVEWIGRSMELFTDPGVMYGGERVGGVRVRALTDIPEAGMAVNLQERRGKKRAHRVECLRVERPAAPEPRPISPELAQLLTDYELTEAQLDAWCAAHGRPAVALMPDGQRGKLAGWLAGEGGSVVLRWLSEQEGA